MSSFVGFNDLKPVTDDQKKENRRKSSNFGDLNELFGIPDSRFEIIELSVMDLVPYRNHKFKPASDAKRDLIKESIKEFGVMEPVIVRPADDIAYSIDGKYEILAGHQRTELSREIGNDTVPAIVKKGLSEDEAEQIVTETNMQRSFEEMSYSERAAVLASHYNAQKRRNVRTEILEEINSYLQTYANPVNSTAEGEVSPGATVGIREVADGHDLSKDTIARYIRIDTLNEELKLLLDDGVVPFKAAVQLSYISTDNQELFVSLMSENHYKCNEDRAKLIREFQDKDKLTIATMTEILSGRLNKPKPGRPKGYKISGKMIQKYFKDETDEKKIGEIIEDALRQYFGEEI